MKQREYGHDFCAQALIRVRRSAHTVMGFVLRDSLGAHLLAELGGEVKRLPVKVSEDGLDGPRVEGVENYNAVTL